MKIKPNIIQSFVLKLPKKFCELVAYSFLRPFFINKINQVLVTIHFLCLSKMHLGGDSRVFKILVKLHWRTPFHIRFHAPN